MRCQKKEGILIGDRKGRQNDGNSSPGPRGQERGPEEDDTMSSGITNPETFMTK
jgi:hypothetical protein